MHSQKDEIRFWRFVGLHSHYDCWDWNGALNKDGYATFSIQGKSYRANRFSWEMHNGEIPDGINVLHKCDNRACVNPNHMFLGSQKDNVQDAISKGRQNQSTKNTHLVGENHPSSKLSNHDIEVIRTVYAGGSSLSDIAKVYSVNKTTISRIVNHKRRN
jgi:hypothetical protein